MLASVVPARNSCERPVDKKQRDFSIGYFILALLMMFVVQYYLQTQSEKILSYSQFKTLLKRAQVTDVVVREKEISGAIKETEREREEVFTD